MPSPTGPSKIFSPPSSTITRSHVRSISAASWETSTSVAPRGDLLGDARLALALEGLVADGEHLVDEQHVGVEVRGDREAQAQEHARRVRRHRRVDEVAELGERDDRVQALLDLLLDEAVQRAVEEDVLAPGEVAPEAGAELELRDDLAAAGDAAGVQRHDPRQHAQRRGLARAVAPDHADGLARLDAQRDVAQRLHRRRAAGALRGRSASP